MAMTHQEAREQIIQGIRELADWLEQNPEAPTPSWAAASRMFFGPEAAADFQKAVIAVKPTDVRDEGNEYGDVMVRRHFAGGIDYSLRIARKYLIPETHVAPPLPDWLTQYQQDEADQ